MLATCSVVKRLLTKLHRVTKNRQLYYNAAHGDLDEKSEFRVFWLYQSGLVRQRVRNFTF